MSVHVFPISIQVWAELLNSQETLQVPICFSLVFLLWNEKNSLIAYLLVKAGSSRKEKEVEKIRIKRVGKEFCCSHSFPKLAEETNCQVVKGSGWSSGGFLNHFPIISLAHPPQGTGEFAGFISSCRLNLSHTPQLPAQTHPAGIKQHSRGWNFQRDSTATQERSWMSQTLEVTIPNSVLVSFAAAMELFLVDPSLFLIRLQEFAPSSTFWWSSNGACCSAPFKPCQVNKPGFQNACQIPGSFTPTIQNEGLGSPCFLEVLPSSTRSPQKPHSSSNSSSFAWFFFFNTY